MARKKRKQQGQTAINPAHKLKERIRVLKVALAEKTAALKARIRRAEAKAYAKAVQTVTQAMQKKAAAKMKLLEAVSEKFEKKYAKKLAKKLPSLANSSKPADHSTGKKRGRGRPRKEA